MPHAVHSEELWDEMERDSTRLDCESKRIEILDITAVVIEAEAEMAELGHHSRYNQHHSDHAHHSGRGLPHKSHSLSFNSLSHMERKTGSHCHAGSASLSHISSTNSIISLHSLEESHGVSPMSAHSGLSLGQRTSTVGSNDSDGSNGDSGEAPSQSQGLFSLGEDNDDAASLQSSASSGKITMRVVPSSHSGSFEKERHHTIADEKGRYRPADGRPPNYHSPASSLSGSLILTEGEAQGLEGGEKEHELPKTPGKQNDCETCGKSRKHHGSHHWHLLDKVKHAGEEVLHGFQRLRRQPSMGKHHLHGEEGGGNHHHDDHDGHHKHHGKHHHDGANVHQQDEHHHEHHRERKGFLGLFGQKHSHGHEEEHHDHHHHRHHHSHHSHGHPQHRDHHDGKHHEEHYCRCEPPPHPHDPPGHSEHDHSQGHHGSKHHHHQRHQHHHDHHHQPLHSDNRHHHHAPPPKGLPRPHHSPTPSDSHPPSLSPSLAQHGHHPPLRRSGSHAANLHSHAPSHHHDCHPLPHHMALTNHHRHSLTGSSESLPVSLSSSPQDSPPASRAHSSHSLTLERPHGPTASEGGGKADAANISTRFSRLSVLSLSSCHDGSHHDHLHGGNHHRHHHGSHHTDSHSHPSHERGHLSTTRHGNHHTDSHHDHGQCIGHGQEHKVATAVVLPGANAAAVQAYLKLTAQRHAVQLVGNTSGSH